MAVSTNAKNVILGQKGSRGGHVIHFWNLTKFAKLRSKGVMWGHLA